MSTIIEQLERAQLREVPRFKAGDTVRIHFRVIEGTRQRIQVFEGIVIKRQGAGARETFTVRKNSFGVGVERTFPLHSPKIDKIDVAAIGDVQPRQAVLPPRQGRQEGPRPRVAPALIRLRAHARSTSAARTRDFRSYRSRHSCPVGAAPGQRYPRRVAQRTGRKLLAFDRRLGVRFVAGRRRGGTRPACRPARRRRRAARSRARCATTARGRWHF